MPLELLIFILNNFVLVRLPNILSFIFLHEVGYEPSSHRDLSRSQSSSAALKRLLVLFFSLKYASSVVGVSHSYFIRGLLYIPTYLVVLAFGYRSQGFCVRGFVESNNTGTLKRLQYRNRAGD